MLKKARKFVAMKKARKSKKKQGKEDQGSDPCFFWGERDRLHFPHFPVIGFKSLISKIRPAGFIMTGLTQKAWRQKKFVLA